MRLPSIVLAALLLVPSSAAAEDFATTAVSIVPPGIYGSVPPPPGAEQEARMYDGLTPLFANVSAADLDTYFKRASFGVDPSALPAQREAVPRAGVTIERDRFGVPHITGRTGDDVTWAVGWVMREDRGLLAQVARYPARLAAIDAPNIVALALVETLDQFTPSPAVDRMIDRTQTAALLAAGAPGRALLHDIDVYLDGVNARLRAEGSSEAPYTRVDVYAANALAAQAFGEGGGDEAVQAMRLDAMRKRLGRTRGSALFDDLTGGSGDPDTPVSIDKEFTYGVVPRKAPGSVVLDEGSVRAVPIPGALPGALTRPARRYKSSNFLIAGRERSASGHPILVGGPQVGLRYPGLMYEVDIKGPGFQARGVTSPGYPGSIVMGRGPDFAWSQTTAATDMVDTFAETLCGSSRTRYLYRGRCRRMGTVDAGLLNGRQPVRFRTTVHGPVVGYGRVQGRLVALSRKRASYGRDILTLLPYTDLTLGRVRSARSFVRAFAGMPSTFNVGYIDDRDIAMVSTGRLPVRDPRVDPRLPTKGTGEYEWRGVLPYPEHARTVNPRGGVIVNWNNKPARGFGSADAHPDYAGSIYDSQRLERRLARRRRHDPASVVGAMNAAATTDNVITILMPTLARVLRATEPPSPRAARMLALLEQWRANGANHLDRDGDGFKDGGAGPVVMAAAWPRIAHATLEPTMGAEVYALVGGGRARWDIYSYDGAAAQALVDKALRQVLGIRLRRPFRTRFCGRLAACSARLWRALDATAADLEQRLGPDPAGWRQAADLENFRPVPLFQIRATLRPNGFQQAVMFGGHRQR